MKIKAPDEAAAALAEAHKAMSSDEIAAHAVCMASMFLRKNCGRRFTRQRGLRMRKLLKFESLRTDLDAIRNGVWRDHPALGVSFLVRGVGYRPFVERRAADTSAMPPPGMSQDEVWAWRYRRLAQNVADNLLLGWNGFDEHYSAEATKEMLVDPAFEPLCDIILSLAQGVGTAPVEWVDAPAAPRKKRASKKDTA
ncbi:hypothetical protein [Ensifer soli]|uniref:hypothetical protein n=1 Tax=Ciceribacter sp. sgz301302 TaxID=3342379 RepID=UPI0035B7CDF8